MVGTVITYDEFILISTPNQWHIIYVHIIQISCHACIKLKS